jgi:phage major head subunit gpT-like protein
MKAFFKGVRFPGGQLTVEAAKTSEDGHPQVPTFAATAYSGGVVPAYTVQPPLDAPLILDLSGMSKARNVVVNLDHNQKQRVGHATDVVNDTKTLSVTGNLSAATIYRDDVAMSAANGFPWEVSLEAELRNIRKLAEGKSEIINGQSVTGPLYIARKSQLTGLAFVSQGADEGNSVSIAASAAGDIQMDEFSKWLIANEFDPETITDRQKVILQAQYQSTQKAPTKVSASDGDMSGVAQSMRMENTRKEAIRKISMEYMKTYPHLIDQIEDMGRKATDEGMSEKDYELEILRATRTQGTMFTIGRKKAPDSKVFEAALCMAASLPNIEKHYSEEVLDNVDKAGMRHYGIKQLLIHAACSQGYSCRPGETVTQGNLREVLEYAFPRGPRRMEAAGSTISLPGILANVASKELLAGYEQSDQTWREISTIKSVPDFKTMTSYRLTDAMEYELLPKGGEIKHGTLSEESYTRAAKTYAKMLGLDRQDIINDDLSAFDDLRMRLGAGAATKFNNIFWAEFLDNSTFFTAARVNYISGSTTNLGIDGVGLALGVAAFDALKSTAVAGEGKRIGGRPEILLVPPELDAMAQRFYKSELVNTGGSSSVNSVPNANIYAGLYRPIKCPWLSDSTFTGYSTTAWYLLRSPRILPAMVVSYLNGQQTPTIESSDADFNTLGIQFRGYHDFGCNKAEYLCGVMSKGAS